MRNALGWGWAAVLALLVAGCGDDAEEQQAAEGKLWDSCERSETSCTCTKREGGSMQAFPPADDCSGFDCCLLNRDEASAAASCGCLNTNEACEDLVGEDEHTTVVSQCPPPGEMLSPRAACVPEGSKCPNRALGLDSEESGCCEGLLCLSNGESFAQDVCQAVGDRDPQGAEACERATLLGYEELEVVSGSLVTDRGTFTFDSARSTIASVGPGCLRQLNMAFTAAGGVDGGACELVLDAILFEGEWVVRRVLASFEACEGYSGAAEGTFDVREAAEIPFGFGSSGEDCGAHDKFDEHCIVGTFDWQLEGELGGITFEGSQLKVRGVVCGHASESSCDEIDVEN